MKANAFQLPATIMQHALPSLGFFGGTWADNLEIEYTGPIQALKIQRMDSKKDFLNFRGVLVKSQGKNLTLSPSDFEVTFSSIREKELKNLQDVRQLVGFHSKREVNPWWQINFKNPVDIDSILLFNRRDALGTRSRHLKVDVTTPEQETITVYDSTSQEYYEEVLRTIEGYAGGNITAQLPTDNATAQKWRDDAVNKLARSLREGAKIPTQQEWLKLACLLPTTYSAKVGGHLSGNDWFVLAYGMCAQVVRDPRSRSGVQAYGSVLNSVEKLQRFEAEFEDVCRSLGTSQKYHHVRHGISPTNGLSSASIDINKLLQRLETDLSEKNLYPLLAYGTLLGAYRDGKLLDHDDDFDVIVPIQATSVEEFAEKKSNIYSFLKSKGWIVSPVKNCHNGHLSRSGLKAHLDMFAVHVNGADAWTHMENMKWRKLPSDWFEPGKQIKFQNIVGTMPKDTEQFLEARYGKGWTKPAKFFEWRWPLSE